MEHPVHPSTSRWPVWAPGILLAAAGLRAWSVVSLSHDPHIADPILDSRFYLDLAARLAQGLGWPSGAHFFGPLYPYGLGRLFSVVPPSILAVQIAQSIVGLAALALLMLTARRWFGSLAALIAGGLYALYGPVLAMESQVLMESLLLFFACAALWSWPAPGRSPLTHLVFGLACGLLAAGRGSFLLLPVLAVAGLIADRRRPCPRGAPVPAPAGAPARTVAISIALIAVGTVLPLLPQTIAQTRATGHLQVLTLNSGLNLYVGNHPAARGIFSEPADLDLNDDLTGAHSASLLAGRALDLEQSSRYWRDRAVAFLRERPGRAGELFLRKAWLFFSPREIPQVNDFHILADTALPLRVACVRFGMILPFAALGLVALRSRRAALRPWVALIAVAWIQTVIFFATGRYRIPVVPAFLGLAGLGIHHAIGFALPGDPAASRREGRRWRRATPLLLAAAVAILLQLLPSAYPAERARSFDAYQMGVRYMRVGRTTEALRAYERAIRHAPESGEAWHGKATALYHQQRLPEAIGAYREALRRMPRSAITWYAMGLAFRDAQDAEAAARAFQTAVQLNDRNIAYRLEFGDILARLGRREEALAQWRAILELQPGQPDAAERLRVAKVAH